MIFWGGLPSSFLLLPYLLYSPNNKLPTSIGKVSTVPVLNIQSQEKKMKAAAGGRYSSGRYIVVLFSTLLYSTLLYSTLLEYSTRTGNIPLCQTWRRGGLVGPERRGGVGGWPTRGRRERYIYKTQYCSRTLCTHPPNAAVYYAKTGSLDRRGCIYTVLICRYLGMEDVTRALYMYVCM